MAHNWPKGLRDAVSASDFDEFLARSWRWCPDPARGWMKHNLIQLGVDPKALRSGG